MQDKIKTYSGHAGSHMGSSGFTNHFTGGPITQARALAAVFRDFPDAVVLNGADDFTATLVSRAPALCAHFRITPLAYFHTGISGIAKSGVVLSREDYQRFTEALKTTELTYEDTVYEKDGRGGVRRMKKKVTKAGNNYRGNIYMGDANGSRYGCRGYLSNGISVQGRSFIVRWEVSIEDGSVAWSLDNKRGTTYLLEDAGGGLLRAVNKRTGRPPSTKLSKVRFVQKREFLAVADTPAAHSKEGWHGSAFYG